MTDLLPERRVALSSVEGVVDPGFVVDGELIAKKEVAAEDLPYLAGILDGEGTIYWREARHSPIVRVTNTHRPLLDWIAQRWGGSIHVEKDYNHDGHQRKAKWRWNLSGYPATTLLAELQPYLIVKTEAARQCLERWGAR